MNTIKQKTGENAFWKAYREIESLQQYHENKSFHGSPSEQTAHQFQAMAYSKSLGCLRAAYNVKL